jgi:hypothetical protein
MEKILQPGEEICLYCGEQMKQYSDDGYSYVVFCDCKDYKINQDIDNKIYSLEQKRPKPKFEIIERNILYKINQK